VDARLHRGRAERLEPEGEDRVVVGEEHEGHPDLAPHLPDQLQHPRQRDPGREGALGRALDHRAVRERVREGDADLDDVGAAARDLHHQIARGRQRRVARGEVGDERALAAGPQRGEGGVEPRGRTGRLRAHAWPPGPPGWWPLPLPSARPTVCTSLSPRPDNPTTTVWLVFMRAAARMACATACADSSAGMMPSRRVKAWNPSRASASVTDTYSKRPASL